MDDAVFLYRNRADSRFYDASTQEMRGGPDKVIVYLDGVLCAMDREARIAIPISRWQLAEIGLACFWTALRGKSTVARPVEPMRLPDTSLETYSEQQRPPAPADRQDPEDPWDRLMREMRDLSR
jgi:hypothetical protein